MSKSLKVFLTFESVDKILWCDHSNETSLPVLSYGAICFQNIIKQNLGISLEFCPWPLLALKGLKGLYHKDIAVFGQFCVITSCLNSCTRLSESPSLLVSGSGSRLQLCRRKHNEFLACTSRSRKSLSSTCKQVYPCTKCSCRLMEKISNTLLSWESTNYNNFGDFWRQPGRQRTLFLRYIQHLLGDTDNMIGPGKLSELAQDRCGWRSS